MRDDRTGVGADGAPWRVVLALAVVGVIAVALSLGLVDAPPRIPPGTSPDTPPGTPPVEPTSSLPGRPFDEALYARLLLRHTRETPDPAGVRVAYEAIRNDPEWAALLEDLDAAGVPTSRAGALAFWINAYNIVVIETVVRGHPVESIRDLGSPIRPVWRRREVSVAGRPRSLDEIEHEILRPMGEPRIHGALVCASVSCPTLRREPWTEARLDEQLEASLEQWLGDPRKGLALDRDARRVRISKVFDWFADDFGGSEADVLAFVAAHLPEEDAAWLREHDHELEVDYFRYDWRLNDAPTLVAAPSGVSPAH